MPPITSRSLPWVLLLLIFTMGAAPARSADPQDSGPGRRIIHKTIPTYPALARQIHFAGTVKVVAVVTPEGKVKTVEPVGGNPILIEAATQAIVQWKFAPATEESREVIELHFNP
jgi:TonB family protein